MPGILTHADLLDLDMLFTDTECDRCFAEDGIRFDYYPDSDEFASDPHPNLASRGLPSNGMPRSER